MHFAVQKDVLAKALKDVTNAVATRVVQPILSNVLIESVDANTIKFQGTDLDLAIETKTTGVVYTPGTITLPGKKLLEIVGKLPNELVVFQIDKETLDTTVTCKRSKFNMVGLAADDFPRFIDARSVEGVLMPLDILRKAIVQTGFAAASFEQNSILGGIYMVIENGKFECAATDGSRLANRSEVLNVSVPSGKKVDGDKEIEGESKTQTATLDRPHNLKSIIPARACNELVKLLDGAKGTSSEVRLALVAGQIVFETDTHYLSTRLISGEYPRYLELFPASFTYQATFSREEMMSAIERVAVMSDDRTHLIKMHFEGETLQITANTPDLGRAQEEVSMNFEGQVLDVAVNVRYLLDVLQRLGQQDVSFEMTGSLKPIIIKGVGDDNYRYLLMPVQSK
ncbi:DNA polymerase III subunit beta [soil metagenome]